MYDNKFRKLEVKEPLNVNVCMNLFMLGVGIPPLDLPESRIELRTSHFHSPITN
jgi:hypothetical protein